MVTCDKCSRDPRYIDTDKGFYLCFEHYRERRNMEASIGIEND